MIDERTEELASLHAFGLLEDGERRAFEQRLRDDAGLRADADSLRETAHACALLADGPTPSPALRSRILASCATHNASSGASDRPVPFRLPAWPAWAAAAALAMLSAYLGVTVGTLDHQLALVGESEAFAVMRVRSLDTALESERIVSMEQTFRLKSAETRIASLDSELAETRTTALARIAELEAQADIAALKIASLNSLLGNAPDATAIAVWNPFSQEGVLSVSRLPALAPDKDYQLWVVDPQYAIPVDGGVFTVDAATGETHFKFKTDKPIKTVAAFAVSLERKGGVPKAEGPMVLITK